MQSEHRITPSVANPHGCCPFSRLSGKIHDFQLSSDSIDKNLSQEQLKCIQKQKIEEYVLSRLQEYSRKKSTGIFRLKSLISVRRHLKRDLKSLRKQLQPCGISEKEVSQYIDETLEKVDSYVPRLRSLNDLDSEIKRWCSNSESHSSKNIHNQWTTLQITRAKLLFPNTDHGDQELLSNYRRRIMETLTPKQLNNDGLPLHNKRIIDLDSEYCKLDSDGREYLRKIFQNYRARPCPNLSLIKEMVNLGMEQMLKIPKSSDLEMGPLSILSKASFIVRSKKSYSMNLKNVTDDFMLLRFGHSLGRQNNEKDSIRERFMSLIHMFLNTFSILLRYMKSDSLKPSSSLLEQFHSDLPSECILSPIVHIDQWTWLFEKWKTTLQTFPINFTKHGAFGRLVRTTIGVGIARLYGIAENNERDDLDMKFFQALQMGLYYGIAYALVDGLQDIRSEQQRQYIDIDKWLIEMERVLCGHRLDQASLPKLPITRVLIETFQSLAQLTSDNFIVEQLFTDLALLLRSQRTDTQSLKRSSLDDVDLYIGPLLKSHFTYTATACMGGTRMNACNQRSWTTPFLGQLTDDCRDFIEDRKEQTITPVTYFIQHDGSILNPFFVFLFVCEDLYLESHSEKDTGAFLGRRIIRTLRSMQDNLGEFLSIFTETSNAALCNYMLSLTSMFDRVSDPEKSMIRSVNKFAIEYALNHRTIEAFIYDHLPLVESQIAIEASETDELVRGINYSLKAGGKRLRPLLLLMVSQICNIELERVMPLARAIEYLHTSSLIFDDLPAQDNAPLRRGHPTLHMPIDGDGGDVPPSLAEGRAQLSAISLIAYAIHEVTVNLKQQGFPSENINQVTAELSRSMHELCLGQFLDLQAARTNRSLTIQELDHIAALKTGKAIETVLICPVLLVDQCESLNKTIEELQQLGRLMGILFQMKDDLLDVEGDVKETGKKINIDQENQTVTYVKLLGIDKTRARIQTTRKAAEAILDNLWPRAGTIRDVIRHICERTK